MKELKNIFRPFALFLLLFAGVSACKKDDKLFEPKIILGTEETIAVSNRAAEQSIDIVSNLSWTAKSDAGWITISGSQGEKGKRVIKFSVAENGEDERTGTITITASSGDISKEIKVVQESGLTDNFYVKANGTGEGTSWEDATSLANALRNCVSGSTIYIAAGTYVPSETITGGDPADDGDITFEINKYITLKGGYPQNAGGHVAADPSVNKTILSGKLSNGSETYHVVTVSAPKADDQKVVLDGLVISDGNAGTATTTVKINGTDFRRDYGGGVTIGNARAEVVNCEITGNKSQKFVAGIYIFGASEVTIKGAEISKNVSKNNGAGLWVSEANAYIYNSRFTENESPGTAPGVHAYPDANLYMYNSVVANNKGNSYGAGIYLRQKAKGVFVNCLVYGNESASKNGGGGIMMYDNCTADVISSTITGNKIAGPGGGIYRRLNTNTLHVYNSIISGNIQSADGQDIDVYETGAVAAVIWSSVSGSKAYDATGGEIAGSVFNAGTMLNAAFVPVGNNNPALNSGMSQAALLSLGATFSPALENFISSDLNGETRSGLAVMGALVK